MNELQILMNDISKWSDETFGDMQRNPTIVWHLKKEVDELIQALEYTYQLKINKNVETNEYAMQLHKTNMEYADCFMLLLDSAHHFKLTAEDLIQLTNIKLTINKARKWDKPDKNGVVEHVRDATKNNNQKEVKTTLEGFVDTYARQSGRSTRQIDIAVNLLFQGYIVEVKDHYKNGNDRRLNKRLFEEVLRRLRLEHGLDMLIERNKIKINKEKLTIELL